MKVGLLTASASRQAGGLFYAMTSFAQSMSVPECQIEVFAGRDQHTESDRSQWGPVPMHILGKAGPAAFGYTPDLYDRLEAANLDVLHTHGLWMYPSFAVQNWGLRNRKPWLVSPHGMLDPWAVRNSGWKKRLAGLAFENRHLKGAACLHALCEAEANAFRMYGLKNPCAVIPNGIELPNLARQIPKPAWSHSLDDKTRVLFFLGRLHPKKGLENILRAWHSRDRTDQSPWALVIAGWDQNGHRAELEGLVNLLGIADSVYFVGPMFGELKAGSLMRADAFVLPSFSEGLPMAVLEAWAYGLPVLMTPQCNLPEGFSAGAALQVEPNVASLASGLDSLFRMSATELDSMGRRGRHLVEAQFTWPHIASQMCEVYRWVLGNGPKPACVHID